MNAVATQATRTTGSRLPRHVPFRHVDGQTYIGNGESCCGVELVTNGASESHIDLRVLENGFDIANAVVYVLRDGSLLVGKIHGCENYARGDIEHAILQTLPPSDAVAFLNKYRPL